MVEQGSLFEFGEVIAKFITRMGFDIDSSEPREDGVDFVAKTTNPMGGKVVSLIRASRMSRLVNEEDIESLHEAMDAAKAVRSAYITTSGFSDEAVEEAKDKPISLINKYQLMDSLEKRGLSGDKDLMDSLETFGMAEKHFQGIEQSFKFSKSEAEARDFFEAKAKKEEKIATLRLRYAPLSVLRVVTSRNIMTADQTLRREDMRDYMFVNLNNLDLYYITQKRKKGGTQYTLHRSDIVNKINNLPGDSKEHLLHLLDHGDLPVEDLEGKDLSILKNTKVINIYEGKKRGGALTDVILAEFTDTVSIITKEVITAITAMGETAEEPVVKKPERNVTAEVNMPHVYGGLYDIWKYLDVERGVNQEATMDPIIHSSREVGKLMESVMGGSVKNEGILFMPYYRAKYVDEKKRVKKYEILFSPQFKKEMITHEKKELKTAPRIKAKKRPLAGDFRLIK